MTGPVTLSDLNQDNKLLWLYCTACGREREVPPLSIGLPPETPVPSAGSKLTCSACGGRNIIAKPELYPGGILAMREKHRGSP